MDVGLSRQQAFVAEGARADRVIDVRVGHLNSSVALPFLCSAQRCLRRNHQ